MCKEALVILIKFSGKTVGYSLPRFTWNIISTIFQLNIFHKILRKNRD